MKMVPVAGFAALSGTGKTTLIEGVIRVLRAKGLRVAAVKHDGHGYEPDREGKDSWRFSRAGAALSVVSAGDKTAWFSEGGKNLAQLLAFMPEMDMILVEGYKREVCRQIGICRLAAGKPLPETPERYEAIATDTPLDTEVPQFSLNDPEGLADFLLTHRETFLTPVGPDAAGGRSPRRSSGSGRPRRCRRRRNAVCIYSTTAWCASLPVPRPGNAGRRRRSGP